MGVKSFLRISYCAKKFEKSTFDKNVYYCQRKRERKKERKEEWKKKENINIWLLVMLTLV